MVPSEFSWTERSLWIVSVPEWYSQKLIESWSWNSSVENLEVTSSHHDVTRYHDVTALGAETLCYASGYSYMSCMQRSKAQSLSVLSCSVKTSLSKRGTWYLSMQDIERIDRENLFSLTHNTRIRGVFIKLTGGRFRTDKRRYDFTLHIACGICCYKILWWPLWWSLVMTTDLGWDSWMTEWLLASMAICYEGLAMYKVHMSAMSMSTMSAMSMSPWIGWWWERSTVGHIFCLCGLLGSSCLATPGNTMLD